MDRNLDLTPSQENVRDPHQPAVVKFRLEEIKQHFVDNMLEIKAQFDVSELLLNQGKQDDAENIWRYQIVFLESAFDFYLHEVTKYGLSNIFEGRWKKTQKYHNIKIDIELLEKILNDDCGDDWFATFINALYAKVTMVSYESVKDHINLIGLDVSKIADKAFYELGSDERTIDKMKRIVNELFNRRNVIAHQSDRKHANAEKNSITREQVEYFILNIEKIVFAIHEVAIEKIF